MKLKRIVALVLALVIVLSVSMVSASSLPRRTLVRNSISVDICVQDGNIVASCRANLYYGTNPSVRLYIQKEINGIWTTVGTGSGILDATTYVSASAGSYRACASLKVTEKNGNASSTATLEY